MAGAATVGTSGADTHWSHTTTICCVISSSGSGTAPSTALAGRARAAGGVIMRSTSWCHIV